MNRTLMAQLGFLLCAGIAAGADEPQGAKVDAKLLALHTNEAKRWEIFLARAHQAGGIRLRAGLPVDQRIACQRAKRSDVRVEVRGPSRRRGRSLFQSRGRPSGHHARVSCHRPHAALPAVERFGPRVAPPSRRATARSLRRPAPEATARGRTRQMRELAREFTAHTVDDREVRWQLRLLSRPLYRYEMPGSDLIDGAIFAFVSDAGTDPEIILFLEAVKDGAKETWRCRTVRLSISSLYVQYKGKEVWRSFARAPADHSTIRSVRIRSFATG